MKNEISYYVKYVDCHGIQHYAIHKWNRLTGFVTSMQDIKS